MAGVVGFGGGGNAGIAACGHPPFGAGNWPPACYRPFSASSPFNTPLPPDRGYMERHSSRAIAGPVTQSRVGNLAEDPLGGGGEPVYYSRSTDPGFTLNCIHDQFGRPDHGCPIDSARLGGMRLRVPAGARPEGNMTIIVGRPRTYDSHLIVVDQAGGWEYDLWQVQSTSSFQALSGNRVVGGLKAGGGRIDFSWGSRIRLAGTGSSVGRPPGDPLDDSNAAHWAERAGRVRAEEFAAGKIDHALFLNTPCVGNVPGVYPADPVGRGFFCNGSVKSDLGVLPLGSRIWLDMTGQEIAALPIPRWKKTMLSALATYGGFVGDTNADPRWLFYIETEGGNMYSSLKSRSGQPFPDLWYKFAQDNNWPICTAADCLPGVRVGKLYRDPPTDNYDYAANIWPKLRVVQPCVTPAPPGRRC